MAFIVIQLDVTIVNVALPAIGAKFDAPIAGLQWIVDSYTMALAVILLTAGIVGDRIGSRRIFITGFAIFGIASLVCGIAPSQPILIIARSVQGLGGALVLPTSLALIAHACRDDDARRARSVGIWAASGAMATAAGPVLGGLLTATLGWRWIFLVNVPLCAAALLLAMRYLEETPRHAGGRFDVPGQLLITGALVALITAIIHAGQNGWTNMSVVASIVVFATTALAFIRRQARHPHPLVPLSMFRNQPFTSSVLAATTLSVTFYGLMFVLSLYFQSVLHYSPVDTGLAFLPLTGVIAIANLCSARLSRSLGYRNTICGGLAIAATGYAYLAILPAYAPLLSMAPAMMLVTLGMGTAIPATATVVIGSVAKQRAGTASAVLNTARQFGGAVGVAVFGAMVAGDPEWMGTHVWHVYGLSAAVLYAVALYASSRIRPLIVAHVDDKALRAHLPGCE